MITRGKEAYFLSDELALSTFTRSGSSWYHNLQRRLCFLGRHNLKKRSEINSSHSRLELKTSVPGIWERRSTEISNDGGGVRLVHGGESARHRRRRRSVKVVEIERHVAERYSSHSTPSLSRSLPRSTNEACGGGGFNFQEESPHTHTNKIKSNLNRTEK